MSAPSTPLAYLNGAFISGSTAAVPVWDRGVVQGATVTEMVRTFRQVPFRLPEHLHRLRHSMEYLGVEISETDEQLVEIVEKLIASRASSLLPDAEVGIVIFVTPGSIPMYADVVAPPTAPTVCVHTFLLPTAQWGRKYSSGQALVVPSISQIPRQILDPRFKYRSRLHWYLADREAQITDPGAVALLRNDEGFLTETNSGNFFIVSQGRIKTPQECDSLPGISQQFVRELAAELEIPYEVGNITLPEALNADEAFVSSTTYCVLPVTRLSGRSIGNGVPGGVVRSLIERWSTKVGIDIIRQANQDSELS